MCPLKQVSNHSELWRMLESLKGIERGLLACKLTPNSSATTGTTIFTGFVIMFVFWWSLIADPSVFQINPEAVTVELGDGERAYRRPPPPPSVSSGPPVVRRGHMDVEAAVTRRTKLRRHEVFTTSSRPVLGEVFIDGPLSDLPPPPAPLRHRSISQPPPVRVDNQFYAMGTPAQASAAAAFFARYVYQQSY